MDLLENISALTETNLDEMLSQAENPKEVLEKFINETRKILTQTKTTVYGIESVTNKRAKLNYDVAMTEVYKWEINFKNAQRASNDALTFIAEERLKNHKISARVAYQQIDIYTKYYDDLKCSLVSLKKILSEAKDRKNRLLPENKTAELLVPQSSSNFGIEARLKNLELGLEVTNKKLLEQQKINSKLITSNQKALKEVRELLLVLNKEKELEKELVAMKELLLNEKESTDDNTQSNSSSTSERDDELEELRRQLDNL